MASKRILVTATGVSKPVPISPRDNHLVHIEVLKTEFESVAQAAGQGDPKALQVAETWIQHWGQHLEAASQTGVDKAQLAPMVKELTEVAKHIGELQAEVQQQAAQQAAQQQQLMAASGAGLAAAPSPQLAPAPVAPAA